MARGEHIPSASVQSEGPVRAVDVIDCGLRWDTAIIPGEDTTVGCEIVNIAP